MGTLIIPDADIYDFGILTSNVHMSWMRTVAGRLKSDYRYSKDIVYNNFIWPDASDSEKDKVIKEYSLITSHETTALHAIFCKPQSI